MGCLTNVNFTGALLRIAPREMLKESWLASLCLMVLIPLFVWYSLQYVCKTAWLSNALFHIPFMDGKLSGQ